MILISYDISDDKLRTRFSKYLKKCGHRVQYSVFEITNSKRMLKNIKLRIDFLFKNEFDQRDSVMIIETSESCTITRFGYAKNDEEDVIFI